MFEISFTLNGLYHQKSHLYCTYATKGNSKTQKHLVDTKQNWTKLPPGRSQIALFRFNYRPVLSRGETIDSCCSEDLDLVTVLEVLEIPS